MGIIRIFPPIIENSMKTQEEHGIKTTIWGVESSLGLGTGANQ